MTNIHTHPNTHTPQRLALRASPPIGGLRPRFWPPNPRRRTERRVPACMEASGSQAARDTESGRAARKELGRGCWDAPRKPARTGKRNGSGVFARRRLSSFLSARRLMQVRRDPTVCGSAMRAPRPCRVRRCRVPNEGQAALQSSRAPHAASPRRIRRDLINSNERLIGGANNIGRTLRTRFFFEPY
jgi:hypothetical protein